MAEIDFSAVFQLLGSVAADVRDIRGELREQGQKLNDMVVVVNDHSKKLDALYTETQDIRAETQDIRRTMATKSDVASLRQAVTDYHSSVMGHGILISELDERVRRIERHVGLVSATAG